MIRSFADRGTAHIWSGLDTKPARQTCPARLWRRARRKLDDLNQVRHYSHLKTPLGNRLHRLSGSRAGEWAIAINDQYRICFRWEGTDAFDVEITDYH